MRYRTEREIITHKFRRVSESYSQYDTSDSNGRAYASRRNNPLTAGETHSRTLTFDESCSAMIRRTKTRRRAWGSYAMCATHIPSDLLAQCVALQGFDLQGRRCARFFIEFLWHSFTLRTWSGQRMLIHCYYSAVYCPTDALICSYLGLLALPLPRR